MNQEAKSKKKKKEILKFLPDRKVAWHSVRD